MKPNLVHLFGLHALDRLGNVPRDREQNDHNSQTDKSAGETPFSQDGR